MSCVIIGHSKEGSKIIDFVSAKVKLRNEMRIGMKRVNGEKITRYIWMKNLMKNLMKNKVYTRIESQLRVS